MNKVLSGKRKKATARASYKDGTGKVMINSIPIENYSKPMYALKIREPLLLLPELAKNGHKHPSTRRRRQWTSRSS
jgi:ribosomal protein S9